MKEKIAVIGAGPGGLTSAMLLAHKGYKVTVFEKNPYVGGRSSEVKLGDYKFDLGPTFLMMTFILRDIFKALGRNIDDYCDIRQLDPMYKLSFLDKEIFPTANHENMEAQVKRLFPDDENGLRKFYINEKKRYDKMYPCLQKDYSSISSLFNKTLLKAVPYLSLNKTLFQMLGKYFSSEQLKISFTFQAKYLGMSPWECPAAFTIIPFIEHTFGIDHVMGGLTKISDSMAKVIIEDGGTIKLSSPVKQILIKDRKAKGILLENGEKEDFDAVFINADFGYAMTNLFPDGILKKYSKPKLLNKKFSCSTFMLYLGLDKLYQEPHHNIIIAKDYQSNINDITYGKNVSEDMSVYVRNASITDPYLAPPGHSSIYVLVPVPNNKSGILWTEELINTYREKVLSRISQRTSMKDIKEHIVEEKIITPNDWEKEYSIFQGATFNLGHNISQMLYLRPHNRFEEIQNCYLVGGGTHPGSGLPTIYESARISFNLFEKDFNLNS